MLAEDDHADLRKTAEKADTLWSIPTKQYHDVVAAVEPEADSDIIAAIPSRGGGARGNGARGDGRSGVSRGSGSRGSGCPPNFNQQDQASTPQSLAQQSAGLCFFHWSFGEKATKCCSPCS